MTKRNIRLLATGFLISGLLLTAFQTVNGTTEENSESETTEALEADMRVLEEKAVQLELENEQLRAEYDKLIEMQSTEIADNDYSGETEETSEASEDTEDSESGEDTADEDSASEASEYTIVIAEGEPSSVIASQLEAYGLINDFFEFNDYLEDNDLIRRVRPGEFTVTSDMNRDELIEAIIR
ncbi:MAG: hypothetical protein JJU01_02195 [Alkalibacterium sp.]|nr:hypothetical protein [Alkalibacterium sp.]